MPNGPEDGRPNDLLIGAEIELEARNGRTVSGATVIDSPLACGWVWPRSKTRSLNRKVDPRSLVDSCEHPLNQRLYRIRGDRTAWKDGEIEILREPIGLQVAFLEARPAFEDPGSSQLIV
jgi:hypothetical protein